MRARVEKLDVLGWNKSYIIIVDFIINVFMCFNISTYFIILLYNYIIHCMINNIIILLLSVKFIFSCGFMNAVLNRLAFLILRTKVSQDLTFIWWMPRAMDETIVFGSIIWMIYKHFSVLASAITHIRLSMWRGSFSSIFPSVTSTVGIWPSRFFIRMFYNTFINIFCYFHAFKHVYGFFKSNGSTIKSLHTCLLAPTIGSYV